MPNAFAKNTYRRVYIAADRNDWRVCADGFDPAQDLALTYDFALRRQIRAGGGEAHYIDHVADAAALQKLNFKVYEFFARWHRAPSGEDKFVYKGHGVGPALRIELWDHVTELARLVFNLRELRGRAAEGIFLAAEDARLAEVLAFLGMPATPLPPPEARPAAVFFFPIHRWHGERVAVRPRDLKSFARAGLTAALDGITALLDVFSRAPRPVIYLHPYYPLAAVLAALKRDRRYRVVSDKYVKAWDVLRHRRLPLLPETRAHRAEAARLVAAFGSAPAVPWSEDGLDMAALLTKTLLRKTAEVLPRCLQVVDSIEDYFGKRSLRLMVTFSSLGIINALMAEHCRRRGVPIYLVINGLMVNSFLDDAKEATVINAYGPSIKENYYVGMENVVCLGDPRMDAYPARPPAPRAGTFKLVVGTAGFNNLDLNSYLAFEFDFIHDVLEACRRLAAGGFPVKPVLKVRTNGYAAQYRRFAAEYFSDLPVEILDAVPMSRALEGAGLYVSIYSQTLFEASASGVPALYYKTDTEQEMHPPFDGKSELVTVSGVEALVEAIRQAAGGSSRFAPFLDRRNMEKYVGPLDGGAARRNLERVHALLAS